MSESPLTPEEREILLRSQADSDGKVAVDVVIELFDGHDRAAGRVGGSA